MESRKKHVLAVGLLTGLATILTQANLARADVILTIQENGGAVSTTTVIGSPTGAGTNATTSFSTAHYTISVLNGLEQQLTSQSQLLSSTILITKNGTSGDT